MFVITATAKANEQPSLFLQDYQPLDVGNTVFRVNASHAKTLPVDGRNIRNMFSHMVNNKLSVIAGSVDHVGDTSNGRMVSFLARANTTIRGVKDMDRMSSVSANVFLDNDDQTLWTSTGDGDNMRLVQASKEDFSSLLKSRMARAGKTMITASTLPYNHGLRPSVGDFVMYYDVTASDYDFGFALPCAGQAVVASLSRLGQLVNTNFLSIVTAANIAGQPEGVVPANVLTHLRQATNILATDSAVLAPTEGDFTSTMATNFISYMAALYKGTTFFDELKKYIKERRDIAKDDQPLTTMKL